MNTPFRGIFSVLQTPFTDTGSADEAALRREVTFCVHAGAHGLVFPVLGSEFQFLSDVERQQLVEVVIEEAAGRIPVVVGVAGPSSPVAVEHARHAARVGADAVIALPPYIAAANGDELLAYYRAIAAAAERPMFVQNSAPAMSPATLVRLLEEIPWVQYIKEEANPSAHNISAVVQATGGRCQGVFGGALGRWMLSEMRRGAVGFMPAAELPDVYAQVWDAFQAGDEAEARRVFDLLLPEINLAMLLSMRVCKEVLVRRGVFSSARMRQPGCVELDDDDQRELDAILKKLEPLFRV